ncbi:KGG domain-containing protein [Candidatus Finniella inopinata]|nr:KGG domain-containing protein [Candidatus Finniella inopinata]
MATNKSNQDNNKTGNAAKGFASMPHEKVQEIASKGGHASAGKAGHEGMSERGHKGGETRAEQLGHEGYVEMGHKGGETRAKDLGHEGYVEMAHKGGSAPHSSRQGKGGQEKHKK